MSRHPSFGKGNKIKQERNVLKRYERIEVLKKKDRWKGGDSVFGLPKTRGE